MILRGELATPEDLARFQVEAQAAAHLEHPNIVPVYEAGEHDGQAYFSMRLRRGPDAGGSAGRGPLRPRDAARYLAAISRAVHFAHEHGILHRDLKPSNILIDRDDQPHITDFGLAKRVSGRRLPAAGLNRHRRHRRHARLHGPGADQQTAAAQPSPASDVYSLGVILYEMLTGRPPFQAPTPVDTLLLVLDQDPVRPGLLNPKRRCRSGADLPEMHPEGAGAALSPAPATWPPTSKPTCTARRCRCVRGWLASSCSAGCSARRITRWCWRTGACCGWPQRAGAADVRPDDLAGLVDDVTNPLWYLLLWGGGLIVWACVFWQLRKRPGPVLFIERQVAHVWGAAIAATIGVFVIEISARHGQC